jgi:hypothetical protein
MGDRVVVSFSAEYRCGTGTDPSRQLTLSQGGVHLTISSSSLFVALRMVVSNSSSKPRTVRALLAYVPTPTSGKGAKQTLQRLVVWRDTRDTTDSPEALLTPYWGLTLALKTCASNVAFALLHEMFMAVLGHVVAQRDAEPGSLMSSSRSSPTSSDHGTLHIPRIVVTPPDDDPSTSLNAVPTPQNAAFGNQLTVPDPEFKVINRRSPEDPFSDDFRMEEYRTHSSARFDDDSDSDDSGNGHGVSGYASQEGDDEDEDAMALGLGPTWSG